MQWLLVTGTAILRRFCRKVPYRLFINFNSDDDVIQIFTLL